MSNALNDVIVVSLDVRIWSGRKKLRPEDLTTSGRLPPKDLVSLGSKKIFDPKALKPFAEVKRKAETRSAFRQIFGRRITPTQPPWSGRRDVEACAIGKGIVEWLI